MKKNIKIGVTFLIITFLVICFSHTYAAINSNTEDWGVLGDWLNTFIGAALNKSGGILGSVIAPLINVFSILIFLILYALFIGSGVTQGNTLAFPFPDQIVFNKIPLLDPNFINPDKYSIPGVLKFGGNNVISSLYYSFFTLAVTIFVIAAMIIGIKLAISSLAAEKAQYKKALNNWIVGIVLLFTIHYVMAGMFYLNEQIVERIGKLVDNEVEIKFDALEFLPGVGKKLSTLVNGVAGLFGSETNVTAITLHGYFGIVVMYIAKAFIQQDLIASIIFLIIIGQTFGLVITYVKRVFMCIILGMMAPMVVAVDVIKKSMS